MIDHESATFRCVFRDCSERGDSRSYSSIADPIGPNMGMPAVLCADHYDLVMPLINGHQTDRVGTRYDAERNAIVEVWIKEPRLGGTAGPSSG